MIDKIAASAWLVRKSPVTCVTSALLFALAVGGAYAQTKPAPPAPKPPVPAQPAPAAPAAPAAAAQAVPELIYSPWIKQCGKPQDAGGKATCITNRYSFADSGFPMVSIALIEPEGEKKLFRITVPEPVIMPPGLRLVVDQGQPAQGVYITCLRGSCLSDLEATPDMLTKMKSGQSLFVQVVTLSNQVAAFPLPLGDFKKVNEGPATDPKVVEAEQKKLQEDLQRRLEDTRKKQAAQQQLQQQLQQQQQQPPR
jgi:invasion protein IalB